MARTRVAQPDRGPRGSDAVPAGRPRLYLHVGMPKSGTTFLQSLLAGNRSALRDRGLLYPFVRPGAMFLAAVELRQVWDEFGLQRGDVEGTWQRLCERARDFGGPTLLSHELLAAAEPPVVATVAESVGDFELHVVVTARDPVRQLTSHWQEHVKNGATYPFRRLREEVLDPLSGAGEESGFWRAQDLLGVLRRWGAVVPPERLHVVVCPPPAADSVLLWERFSAVLDIPPATVDLGVATSENRSLGPAQVALLCRVNEAVEGRLSESAYRRVVKRFFAERVLAQVSAGRAVVPPEVHQRLAEVAGEWVDAIRRAGHPTYGDVDELLPGPPVAGVREPDDVTAEEILQGVPAVLADLLVEVAELRSRLEPEAGTPADPASSPRAGEGHTGRWALRALGRRSDRLPEGARRLR